MFGYCCKFVLFEEQVDFGCVNGGVEVSLIWLDRCELFCIYELFNLMVDDSGYYDGLNVDLVVEVVDVCEVGCSYEVNLCVFE